jgi:hypothetical protein
MAEFIDVAIDLIWQHRRVLTASVVGVLAGSGGRSSDC